MSALTLVALSHHDTPFSILERVNLAPDAAQALAADLRSRRGIDGAVVLATCNRTELYLAATRDQADTALDLLAARTGVAGAELHDVAIVFEGNAASHHLFRVAAGLESRIIGEREILGQIRATATRAAADPAAGSFLQSLFRWAAATGRRARRDVGPAAPSLACTALDAAGRLGPTARTIVLGAGAMATAVANELSARRLPYLVAARRLDQAARLARHPQDAIHLDQLHHHLHEAGLVVCATSARSPVLDYHTIAGSRSGATVRPLTIVDLSMPRNVAPDVGELDGIKLIHLEQLRSNAGDLDVHRAGEAVRAEHERYMLWVAGQGAGPVIAAFRRGITDICTEEALQHLPPDEAAHLARRTAGRILHAPTLALKELAAAGETAALEALAQALGLDDARADSAAPADAVS